MRTVRRAFVLAALSALVVVAAPTARAQTPPVTSVTGSADGLFVDLSITPVVGDPVGLAFGPEPSVTLPPEGGAESVTVLGVDEDVTVVGGVIALTADTLTTSVEGELGPAGFATAETTAEDLALSISVLNILDVDVISATCSADLDGVTGSTTLVGASVLGTALAAEPPPNTVVPIDVAGNTASVILNRQVENPDGSLSVTALAIEIDISVAELAAVTGTIEIGPATCGVVEGLLPEEIPAEELAPPQPVSAAQVRFTG